MMLVIVQDKKFTSAGEIDYQLGYYERSRGLVLAIRCSLTARCTRSTLAPRGWLRLRLLNGCNAAFFEFRHQR